MEKPTMDYIDKASFGCADFKVKVITIIKEELPMEIEQYRQYLSLKKYKLAASSVHKLKHKIHVFGFQKSYYVAHSFEEDLNLGKISLKKDFEKILTLMENFVRKL